jgi:CBS domain-containing protein
MQNLIPSPAITVPSNTTIRDTLRVMREQNVGSVLVNDYQPPHSFTGIFTERDLLKWVGEIEKHGSWETAIGTIMTKKVITLPLLEIDRAPEIMVDYNIRHVPIVYDGEDGGRVVAGVISMRDVFRGMIQNRKVEKTVQQFKGKRTLLLAYSDRERETQRRLLSDHLDLQILKEDFEQSPDLKKILSVFLTGDLLIFDLDRIPPAFWSRILKGVLDEPTHPELIVIYDPFLQDPKSVQVLRQLSRGSVLHVFPKPLNLLEYLRRIEKCLSGEGVKSPS